MKLLIAFALTSATAFSSSSSDFLAGIGNNHDAGSVMASLTSMMGNAQQKLAVAQRHHKKVVKKIRNEAAAFLEQESNAYGKYLNDFSAELDLATADLQAAVDAAKAGLAKAEAAPANPNDWKDPEVEQRAKLGAEISAAERNIKKAQRHATRAVREGEEQGEETLEDNSQKLGMKLGDMTPLVEKSKKTLESVAEKVVPVKAAVAKAAVAKTDASSKKVDLKKLEDGLSKATQSQQAKTADANKKLDGFLTKSEKEVETKAKKIGEDLEVAQKAEIAKVLGRKEAAPVSKVSTSKTADKKAAPVKAAIKAAPVKAAPLKAAPVKKQSPSTKAAPVKK
jgi:hypothetical protein